MVAKVDFFRVGDGDMTLIRLDLPPAAPLIIVRAQGVDS